MNMKFNEENGKFMFVLILLIIFAWYYGYKEGKINSKEEFESTLEDNLTFGTCEINGCYMNVPNSQSVWVPCPEGYNCQIIPLTEEGKKVQEEERKLWNDTLKNLPPPIQSNK